MADNSQIVEISKVLSVTGIGALTLTPIEQDPSTGRYVREVRLAVQNDDGSVGRIVLSIRVEAATKAGVEVRTPELSY